LAEILQKFPPALTTADFLLIMTKQWFYKILLPLKGKA